MDGMALNMRCGLSSPTESVFIQPHRECIVGTSNNGHKANLVH
eukprot:COSAG02_NODE_191_length_30004_cov_86.740980_12_plen_42_part_01